MYNENMIVFMLLHFGDHAVTQECIESIKRLGFSCEHAVLIVDNDAEPKPWDEPYVVKTGNVGFSEANNIGYKYAKDVLGATMVIAGNNDLVFDEKFSESVLLSYEDSKYAVVGPDVEKVGTGEHQSPIALGLRSAKEVKKTIRLNKMVLGVYPLAYPFMKKYLAGSTQVGAPVTGVTEGAVPCGACVIFTRRFIEAEDKLFCPETKFYYEEFILAKRCQDKGYKIVFDPALHVYHVDQAASVAASRGEYDRIRLKMQRIVDAAGVYLKMLKE